MFEPGDKVKLTKDVGKHPAGTEGVFRDYIDDLTGEVDFGGTRYETVNVADIEKVSSKSTPVPAD